MNDIALESFITYCDNMMIANEQIIPSRTVRDGKDLTFRGVPVNIMIGKKNQKSVSKTLLHKCFQAILSAIDSLHDTKVKECFEIAFNAKASPRPIRANRNTVDAITITGNKEVGTFPLFRSYIVSVHATTDTEYAITIDYPVNVTLTEANVKRQFFDFAVKVVTDNIHFRIKML